MTRSQAATPTSLPAPRPLVARTSSSCSGSRGLLLVAVCSMLFASPAQAGQPAPSVGDNFRSWATAAAKRTGMRLCRGGVARFSAQQKPAEYAVFRQEAGGETRYALVVAWSGQLRAFRTDDTVPDRYDCPPSPVWEDTKVIKLGPWGIGPREFAQVAVVDDQLSVVRSLEEDDSFTRSVDWDNLTVQATHTAESTRVDASMLLLLDPKSPWRAQLPRPRTWVAFKKTAHGGPPDSSLIASTELAGPALHIEMQATDDVVRLPANDKLSDAAFLKTDHF